MTKLEMMQLSKGLSELYTGLETDLISNIADYLKNGSISCSTAQWKIQMLAQLGALDKTNIRTIAEYANTTPELLTETLETAAITAIEELEPGFRELVRSGIVNDTDIPIEHTMKNAIKTYRKQASTDLNMVNTVMLYKAKSAARKVINDTSELAEKKNFLNMLNKAAGKVVTGIESRQAAMRQCIKEMSEKGIPAFVDKCGREWSPEAYINMNIRTTVANTACQAQFDRMDDYGLDLIEVSSHSGARPKCAKDQGKIFNRKNKEGYTTDLYGNKVRYYSWKRSSYGEPDGILGINCGHQVYPFVPGVSRQTYFPYDNKENNALYKSIQGQRELERRVRKSKRECMILEQLGDTAGLEKASVTLKRRTDALKQYCIDNNLSYKSDRAAVAGYNKTVAGKVRKSLTSAKNNDILKAENQSDLGALKARLQSDRHISKEYYTAIKGKFSRGSDNAKKVFTKLIPEGSVSNSAFTGTAYYDTHTKKISMHYAADLKNERGACATWFHEHGHMIDDLAGNVSNDMDFRRLLDDDYMQYMKKYGKKHNLKTFDKVQAAIGKDLSTMREHSAVADIINAVSKNNIRGVAWHRPDYWKDDSAICAEAFAHMYEAQFDEKRYKQMQKYFPNALKKFEEMLGGLV